ncbi:MAG: hypothetical protein JJU11_01645 [Candidatus Sumerlaeia bacterium]|nr:hypothetical protein [Candidatus Sumerlaeia bacterium]
MKKLSILTASFLLAGSVAFAVPYASNIQVNQAVVQQSSNLNISYLLNEEAEEVLIEVIDDGDDVVASFEGTTNRGSNIVSWNTTDDNDEGDLVDVGEGFRIRITASGDTPEEWTEAHSNGLPDSEGDPVNTVGTTVPEWWNPVSLYINHDTEAEDFGLIHTLTSVTGDDEHAGAFVFNSALEPAQGTTINDLIWVPDAPPIFDSQVVWGVSEDPDDPSVIYVSSEGATTALYTADGTQAADLDNADPSSVVTLGVRQVSVANVQGTKYAAFASTAANPPTMYRVEVDSNNELTGTFDNILAGGLRPLAGIDIKFDDEGNLYWLVRSGIESANFGGQIVRWSAAAVAAADPGDPNTLLTLDEALDPGPNLSGDNADWNLIEAPGVTGENFQDRRFLSMTITPDGDVYVLSRRFVYFIGNTSEASLRGQLTEDDRVFDLAPDGVALLGTESAGIESDAFGNLVIVDRSNSAIRILSPGGETSTTITAPEGRTFEISDAPTSVDESWHLYH